VLGNRDTATGRKLWEALQDKEIEKVMTDFWKPYENLSHTKSIRNQRHRHIRLKDITVCFGTSWPGSVESRSATAKAKRFMYSVMLLMSKWNGCLKAIFN